MVKRLDDAAVARVLRDNIPNAATRDTYLARLASLRKLLGAAAAAPDVASVLVEADPRRRMIPKLKRTVKEGVRSVLTVKNMVGAVLATHKHLPAAYAPTSEARAAWAAYHRELCGAADAAYATNRPINDRQEANYVSIDEVHAKFDELRSKPQIRSLRESMAVLLMGVYAHLTPKRSDYGTLHVYTDDAAAARVSRRVLARQNYVVMDKRSPRLLMQRYKTADRYAEVVEPIPKVLAAEMRRSLKAWPRGHVFVGRGGLTPMSNNLFTKYVIRTFAAHFEGRAAGTSLLRHAYVSERVDFNRLSMAERRAIARLMGHTTGTQETVYKWVDR